MKGSTRVMVTGELGWERGSHGRVSQVPPPNAALRSIDEIKWNQQERMSLYTRQRAQEQCTWQHAHPSPRRGAVATRELLPVAGGCTHGWLPALGFENRARRTKHPAPHRTAQLLPHHPACRIVRRCSPVHRHGGRAFLPWRQCLRG